MWKTAIEYWFSHMSELAVFNQLNKMVYGQNTKSIWTLSYYS